ncbi:chemotaxis protein CheX [Vibrio anguillarum]|uniref:chlorinating enzyme n=1 Tax=Vibrio anguillarum TaxID=55601 RepID=UPI0002E74FAC|nr:chlorinating enzyme [Vibrio anguillarum]OEF91350.1 chemotaxis protein CheX [Vibrio anguillarum]
MSDALDFIVKDFSLTEEELASFKKNGFIGPFTLYEPEEMRSIWKKVRRQLADNSHSAYANADKELVGGMTNYDRHLDVETLGEHIFRPEIVHRIRSILGKDLNCWRSEFFPKYKGDEGTDWHQAAVFAHSDGRPQIIWPEEEVQDHLGGAINVWCAFTDATKANGCLQLMPGTQNTLFYDESKAINYDSSRINNVVKNGVKRGFFGYDNRERQVDENWTPDESKAFPVEMKAGQFIIFWSTLLHASLPHTSTQNDMRLGYVARYVPTSVKVYPDSDAIIEHGGKVELSRYGTVLVSGEDNYSHNNKAECDLHGRPFSVCK